MNTRKVRRYLSEVFEEYDRDLWPIDGGPRPEDKEKWATWHYALYEVAVDLEVDMDTGRSRIVAVDGVPLSEIGEFRG